LTQAFGGTLPMRSLIKSNAHTQISGLIYSKVAELPFIGLLLVFIYPFASLISGVDPTVPIEGQSQNKIVYYLQVAFPFLCLAIALLYRGSGICLLAITMIYPIFCLASTTWSVNPYDTFKEASVLLGYILAIAALCQILDIGVFCKIIVRVLAFLILASVVMVVALARYGTHQLDDALGDARAGLWRGVFGYKNQLGAAASASVFIFLFFRRLISASVGFQVMCIVAAIAFLIFVQSVGSWVALCMLVVYYFLLRTAPVSRNFLLLIVFGVGALAFTVFSFYSADLVLGAMRPSLDAPTSGAWCLTQFGRSPCLGSVITPERPISSDLFSRANSFRLPSIPIMDIWT
jgi:exopolysaccharide production protein ExoQ